MGKGWQLSTPKVTLTMEASGKAVNVPLFIQPDSQQPSLLGMNAGHIFLGYSWQAGTTTAIPTTILLCQS